jgi:hypothetical protein
MSIVLVSSVSAIEETKSLPSSSSASLSNLLVSSLKYEPYPVQPGEYFTIWVKIQNIGNEEADAATCMIMPSYPFLLRETETGYYNYGRLGGWEEFVLDIDLRVDENAVEGNNTLEIWCTSDPADQVWFVHKIDIKVQTRYPTLNIMSAETTPSPIPPGEKATLDIVLENFADSSMKDVSIKLDFNSMPITPLGGVTEKKLRRINSNETGKISFDLIAMPDSKGGVFKVPFNLSFTDELGKMYNETGIITINIASPPDIYATIDSTTIFGGNSIGTASIKITNKGLTDLKYFDVKILESDDYDLLSPDRVYVGDVDSDDSETIDVKLKTAGMKKEIPILMNVSFRDVTNKHYEQDLNVTLNILSGREYTGKTSGWLSFLIFVIIVVAAIVLFKNRAKIFRARPRKSGK